jgi:hypothetical protein
MTVLERADGFKMPAGNSAACVRGEQAVPTRDLQTLSSLNCECAVTMEIQQPAQLIAQPPTSLTSEEEDIRRLEVGGAHSSDELW